MDVEPRACLTHFLSDEFTHLVGRSAPEDDEQNYGILKKILASGYVLYRGAIPGESRTSVALDLDKSLASNALIVPTATCYCDIPLSNINFHARKYGRFGLSFHRDFLIRRGARPVMYVPTWSDDNLSAHGKTLLRDIQGTYRGFQQFLRKPLSERRARTRVLGREPDHADGVVDALDTLLALQFLSFLKAYNAELPEDHIDYYYSEREWRITNYLSFVPSDVARIVIAKGYADRLAREMSQYQCTVSVVPGP